LRDRRNAPPAPPTGRPEGKRQRERRQETPPAPSRWQRTRERWSNRKLWRRTPQFEATKTAEIAANSANKPARAATQRLGLRAKWAARRARRRAAGEPGSGAALSKALLRTPAEVRGVAAQRAARRTRPRGRVARRERRAQVGQADELAQKRTEKTVVSADVDDGGFPAYTPPASLPVRQAETSSATAAGDLREYDSASATTGKGTEMTASVQQYLQGADMSTSATQKAAYRTAGETASADAAKYQTKANDLRSDAATMADKPGMALARGKLLREAAAADVTAGKRRGAAAALHARADAIAG